MTFWDAYVEIITAYYQGYDYASAFWPKYMLLSGALILLGWRVNSWKVPALILLGLMSVRFTAPIELLQDDGEVWRAIASCTAWLLVTFAIAYQRTYLVAFLLGISTVVYPLLLALGFRIEYTGILPIVSDLFLILAMLVSGGGILRRNFDRYCNSYRFPLELGPLKDALAKGQGRNTEAIGKDS